jgi:hypothetical protein
MGDNQGIELEQILGKLVDFLTEKKNEAPSSSKVGVPLYTNAV